MNSCMVFHATQENQDIAREEWFRRRLERRRKVEGGGGGGGGDTSVRVEGGS